jgi:hypothetical protein
VNVYHIHLHYGNYCSYDSRNILPNITFKFLCGFLTMVRISVCMFVSVLELT